VVVDLLKNCLSDRHVQSVPVETLQ